MRVVSRWNQCRNLQVRLLTMSATGKQPNAFWQYLISSSHLIMNILLKQLFITNCNELIYASSSVEAGAVRTTVRTIRVYLF